VVWGFLNKQQRRTTCKSTATEFEDRCTRELLSHDYAAELAMSALHKCRLLSPVYAKEGFKRPLTERFPVGT
jgi:hypothetical protein